jgi:hypothetical protein
MMAAKERAKIASPNYNAFQVAVQNMSKFTKATSISIIMLHYICRGDAGCRRRTGSDRYVIISGQAN